MCLKPQKWPLEQCYLRFRIYPRAFGGPDSVLSWAKIELEIVTVKIKIGIEIFERLIAFILA